MFNIKELSSDLENLIISNESLSIKFLDNLQSSKKILLVGDDSLSPILNYTFYMLTGKKKVLIAKSKSQMSKLNYNSILEFEKKLDNPYILEISLRKGKKIEKLQLKPPKSLSQSILLPYLTILTRFNVSSSSDNFKGIGEKIFNEITSIKDIIAQVKDILLDFGRCFCLGRSIGYSIAQEICSILTKNLRIHAESYPAGESKHGPIALIEEGFPVIQIIDNKKYEKKMINSIMEMKARGAKIISITHLPNEDIRKLSDKALKLEKTNFQNNAIIHMFYLVIAFAISRI